MTQPLFLDDVDVKLVDLMGGDASVVRSARVSVVGENDVPCMLEGDDKLINYLMKHRHGSPFEHTALTFYIRGPIFMAREFFRHRIASYNEQSGRYMVLPPEFYVFPEDRNLIQSGSSAHPSFAPGDYKQRKLVDGETRRIYKECWAAYERMIDAGIANEVARAVLPVGLMTQFYVSMNARAMMNFLSLRTLDENATVPSNPQKEIAMVADKMELVFAEKFPSTYAAFNANGRVAP